MSVFFNKTFDFSTVDRIRGERKINNIISCLFWWCRKSYLGEKSISSTCLFVAVLGACVTSSFQSYPLFFHYETHTFRDTDTYSITKNDDDDADDDARDDDAVFVFVFWKKQQKESFDDDHYGEER